MGISRGRRRVLAMGMATIAGALGGCSTITSTAGSQNQQRKPRLCKAFRLANYDNEPHAIHTLISRDNEIMRWWTSDKIPPRRVRVVKLGDWRETEGDYVIYGSYDEYPEWSLENYSGVTLEEDVVCLVGAVEIYEDGNVDVIFYPKGEGDFPNGTEETQDAGSTP